MSKYSMTNLNMLYLCKSAPYPPMHMCTCVTHKYVDNEKA